MRPLCKAINQAGFLCGHTLPCPYHPTAFEARIRALRVDAVNGFDAELVRDCDRALDGDERARTEVARILDGL